MELAIYQINLGRDKNRVCFESLDECFKQQPAGVNAANYDKVYTGDVHADDLEDVYYIFNQQIPEDFAGWSLSVSDVVEVISGGDVKPGYYFCDQIGFKKIPFGNRP